MSRDLSFSPRLPEDLSPSPLHVLRLERPGHVDLMQANPTCCGFAYPPVQVPMSGADAWPYQPHPRGPQGARATLAQYLRGRGEPVEAADLVLSASTRESYAWLFKLLCAAGETVAVGVPSYPLLAHLAALETVGTSSYRWRLEGRRWRLDEDSLEACLQAGARAVVVVTPNNPTGGCLHQDDADILVARSRAYGVPLIVDQVFAPYRMAPAPPVATQLAGAARLFVLDGLSKAAGLPQLKLGWIAVHGEPGWKASALRHLSFIADAYLSVSTPVLQALPELLALAPQVQAQIGARVARNRAALGALLAGEPVLSLLPSEGGWYAVVRLPQHVEGEAAALAALRQANVYLHPGFFYDFDHGEYLVTGLLQRPTDFAAAWQAVLPVLGQLAHA